MELAKNQMQGTVKTVPTPCDDGYLIEIQAENRQLSQEIDSLRPAAAQLKAIAESRGYRFLQALYSIRVFLLPHLSIREQLAARAYRFFRAAAQWPRNFWKSGTLSRPHSGKTALRKNRPLPGFVPSEGSSRDDDARKAAVYTPLNWRLTDETSSDHDFIKLIILAPVHRSGSTLLQRICNARKGTLIWGEHGGLLAHFADIHRSASFYSTAAIQERIQYFSRGENPNLWIGSICPESDFVRQAVVESARHF